MEFMHVFYEFHSISFNFFLFRSVFIAFPTSLRSSKAIGPARAWKLEEGSLTLWPRLEFYVVDGVFLNKRLSSTLIDFRPAF